MAASGATETESGGGLEKRAVAVSFLFKFPGRGGNKNNDDDDDDLDDARRQRPRVALFRRSGAVRTYQHKYAPISGSVEARDASPLATAWREIREETALTRGRQLRLFRQGKPYVFPDPSVGREWTIHPFAFIFTPDSFATSSSHDLDKGGDADGGRGGGGGGDGDENKDGDADKAEDRRAGLRLDWEHEGYAWFDPADVSDDPSFGGVPRLKESLRRVWFEIDLGRDAASVLDRGLLMLQADHESGARQLAGKALDVFTDVLPRLPLNNTDDGGGGSGIDTWWRNVRIAGWHLWKNGREAIGAPILSVVLACLGIIEEKLSALPPSPSPSMPSRAFIEDDVLPAMRAHAARRTETGNAIGETFARFLRDEFPDYAADDGDDGSGDGGKEVKIVTLSCSSTITAALTHAIAQPGTPALDVHVLESRPLFEGVKTARALAAAAAALRQAAEEQDGSGGGSGGGGGGGGGGGDHGHSRRRRRGGGGGVTKVTLHTDSSAAIAARGAHVVLLGADVISPRGDVSNKTGSLPLVLSARHVNSASSSFSPLSSHPSSSPSPSVVSQASQCQQQQQQQQQLPVRVVVLAEKEKVLPFGLDTRAHAEENNDPREVTAAWGDGGTRYGGEEDCSRETTTTAAAASQEGIGGRGPTDPGIVEVTNVYFEWVPAALATDYVTEDGVTTRAGIEEWAARARRRADRFLGDL
ncbi:hypothetical protein JDV02_004277 [Purpureocillium takamizusanense]|uniref:Nudix hydrolase domain-containing protein n=1 Tax=Purpureocillium takamizusanense TaxID=2060973 RepID=A0A9Q8V986_9HYPO|nr:uncharacterized protein JDV02_004277 [Purpureocillium takamizusanense]UNI17975.1 hypothetical protein JDV02_004277 [Purpureocillium takamizusanense]